MLEKQKIRLLLKKNKKLEKNKLAGLLSSAYHQSKKDIEEILLNMNDIIIDRNKITLEYDNNKS